VTDPFTITDDAHSRFLIRWQTIARMDLAQVGVVCDAAMREFGMPERLHVHAASFCQCLDTTTPT
jgi:hypothetical protein